MLFEVLFPAALAGNPAVTLTLLAVVLTFHLGTALFMGLNGFEWAFAATHPASTSAAWQ